MPSVQVSESHDRVMPLPAICVKTGTPTDDVLTIKGSASPGWTWLMIVFGFLPWLVASWGTSKPYSINVPMHAAVWRRHRQWRRVAGLLFVAGIVMGIVATWQGRDDAFLLLLPTVVGFVSYLVNEGVNSVGVQLSRDGGLVLTRVHPNFERALLDSRRSPRTQAPHPPS